jgi:nucleotide-binding universal stress UspA family protein
MINHILVAVDGSAFSVRASRLGAEILSGRSEGTLTLLYIAKSKVGLEWYQGPGTDLNQASEQERQALDAAFKKGRIFLDQAQTVCLDLLKDHGVRLETLMVPGDPAQKIIEQAEKTSCDMIIMGSRGAGPLRGALLGSVSQKVLANSPYPVLIVK